jgi:hypothetical protein
MVFAEMLGISKVEAKQRLAGASGTKWEVDAKGVLVDGHGFLVVECKERSNKKIDQAVVASLAFQVDDVGAQGAVIVTSIGLQKGAEIIARHKGFHLVYLPKDGTFEQFFASCGNHLFQKVSDQVNVNFGLAGITFTSCTPSFNEGGCAAFYNPPL